MDLHTAVVLVAQLCPQRELTALLADETELSADLLATLHMQRAFDVGTFVRCASKEAHKMIARDMLRSQRMHDDLWAVWMDVLLAEQPGPPPTLTEGLLRALLKQRRVALAVRLLGHEQVRKMNLCAKLLHHLASEEEGAVAKDGGGDAAAMAELNQLLVQMFQLHGASLKDALGALLRVSRSALRHRDVAALVAAALPETEARNELFAHWLRLGLHEQSASVLANALCVVHHCTKGHGGAWLGKALALAAEGVAIKVWGAF